MPLSNEEKIEIWKRSIETQIHFAEMSIKMRQIGLTLAGATIALAIVLYRTDTIYNISFFSLKLPVGTILTLSAAFILFAAKIIDVGVYHRMLRGAVKFNEMFEQNLDFDVGWKSGLTEAITAYSRYDAPKLLEQRNCEGSHWTSDSNVGLAGNRINMFYWVCIGVLILAAIGLAAAAQVVDAAAQAVDLAL